MTFGAPEWFWLMLLVPGVIGVSAGWLLWRAAARRRIGGIAPEPWAARLALLLTPLLLVGAIALALFAAARPQFGASEQESPERGIEAVFVLDVSNSMLSSDGQPTRLAQAQDAVSGLLEGMTGDRAGLVIFAGRPFVRSPLTSDLAALSALVGGVDQERGLLDPGSDMGAAIEAGRRLLEGGEAKSRVLIVVSDGEDFGENVEQAVAGASRDGVRIYTAGTGSTSGAPVLDVDVTTGERTPRLDAGTGEPVLTRLDAAALQAVASSAGGRYIDLRAEPLAALQADVDRLPVTDFGKQETSNPIERFQVFAALALLLADVELMLLAIPRRARPGAHRLARLWPLAMPGLFVAALCSTTVADINSDANDAYARGDYGAALDLYRTAQARGERPELAYNAGNALHMLGQLEAALAESSRARCTPTAGEAGEGLCPRVEYALGNHYAAAGRLLEALDAYRRTLLMDPEDDDARHNFEVAARRLTPTPEPTLGAAGTPTPGGEDPSAGGEQPQEETPLPGTGGATPSADGQQQPQPGPRDLSREELQRALAEALAGRDREFTPEEAQRLLDLLNEENRRSIEDAAGDRVFPDQPDY